MMKKVLYFIFILAVSSQAIADEHFVNKWHSYVNLEFSGNDQWVIRKDRVYGSNSVNICQENNNNLCLHIENGYLQLGNIQDHWWSSLWNLNPSDSGFIRIQNKWKPIQYLHIESGYLQVGTIENHWHSPQWKRETVVSGGNDETISYQTFEGEALELYPYDGRNVSLLLQNNSYDQTTINKIVSTLDKAYDEYKKITGRVPSLFKHRNGLLTIAEVNETCGAGCGYLGLTGIEIQSNRFSSLYDNVLSQDKYDQILFYELGRNFWFYENKIDKQSQLPNSKGAITTGYAVFMRIFIMNKLGLEGLFNGNDLSELEKNIRGIITTYVNNPSYTFSNTIAENISPVQGTGATDLFASFLFSLTDTYGDDFIYKLWQKVGNGKNATSKYSSTDNFIVAASKAANKDLRETFETWKWPTVGSRSNEILDNLFATNNFYIDAFYNEYPWYFGNKNGSNYTCGTDYICQKFSEGWNNIDKTIRVRKSDNYLYWKKGNGVWYNYGIRY